jgi:DHA2 family multidrug resistance protein
MAFTLLAQHAQFHQLRLTEHIFPASQPYQETLRQMAAYFASHGASEVDAHRRAIAFVGELVQTQASLLSYIDVFWTFAIVAALAIPVVLLLLRSVRLGAAPVH